jgi:hypothetical protein
MIIEISGLPEGQKIKNINVEVNFEDGVAEINTSTESTESIDDIDDIVQQIIEDDYQASIKGIGESFDKRVEDMMEEENAREPIPIPPEMTDQQF